MTSRKRHFISALILVVFSFVIFGSACFIIEHADHECSGEDCPYCMELAVCGKILQSLGNAVPAAAATIILVTAFFDTQRSIFTYSIDHNTLISLKVELLN